MPRDTFTFPLTVRLHELDAADEVSTANVIRYLEETAMQASIYAGFDIEWYRRREQFWVVRSMRLVRHAPVHYLDALEIDTWISTMTRVRADRNYRVRRTSDHCLVALATANWVYLDSTTMLPARMPPEIPSLFTNRYPAAVPPFGPRPWLCTPPRALNMLTRRHAQYYEADSGRHTNNAIYVDWFEEAVRDAVASEGMASTFDSSTRLWFDRHSLEYLAAARPGDDLEISVRLIGTGRTTGLWSVEIRRSNDAELVARDECTTIWLEDGCPQRWPWSAL